MTFDEFDMTMTRRAERDTFGSVIWALERMIEIRSSGGEARFRIVWCKKLGRREYRLEIKHANGHIERPVYPFPLAGGNCIEEGSG